MKVLKLAKMIKLEARPHPVATVSLKPITEETKWLGVFDKVCHRFFVESREQGLVGVV
jgi:hypothetical protein